MKLGCATVDDFLTVAEVAAMHKLNQQTVRNLDLTLNFGLDRLCGLLGDPERGAEGPVCLWQLKARFR